MPSKSIIYTGLAIFLLICITQGKDAPSPIKKIVLLCMENHSYDNMLGFMDEPIGDLVGDEFNYLDPLTRTQKIYVRKGAAFQTIPDPPHGFVAVQRQLYGTPEYPIDNSRDPDNSGFAWQYKAIGGNPQHVMDIYAPEQLPILTTLAKNFQVHNQWFAPVPTCTDPNKFFLYAAQSGGITANCWDAWYCSYVNPITMNTIFNDLEAEGYTWSIHYMDFCDPMGVSPLDKQKEKFVHDQDFEKFFAQIREGQMDDFTYLIPRITTDDPEYPIPNTQHPSEDVRSGELLIKQVYEELRNSAYWEETLLILVYDEHGGFWDSVTPLKKVSNPAPEQLGTPNRFDFDRLGLRVPAVIISPWIAQGLDTQLYDHSSISATIKGLWKLESPYLTTRAAEQLHFATPETLLKQPRDDCPERLPPVFPSFEQVPLRRAEGNHKRDNVMDQVRTLGSLLVNTGVISLEHYLKVAHEKLNDSQNIVLFMTEAKELLGFKQDIKNRSEYEKKKLIFSQETQ